MADEIVLASGSEIRRKILTNAGVRFSVEPARVDEYALKASLLAEQATARDIADTLAEMKALRVSAKRPGALVIGSDQVLETGGEILNKPSSIDEARRHLQKLRNKTHRLLSAVVLVKDGQPLWRHVGTARMTMRDFSDPFLDEYLLHMGDSILDTVGCYKLEEYGIRLFSKIEGDYFTVLGLPLLELLNHLTLTGSLPK